MATVNEDKTNWTRRYRRSSQTKLIVFVLLAATISSLPRGTAAQIVDDLASPDFGFTLEPAGDNDAIVASGFDSTGLLRVLARDVRVPGEPDGFVLHTFDPGTQQVSFRQSLPGLSDLNQVFLLSRNSLINDSFVVHALDELSNCVFRRLSFDGEILAELRTNSRNCRSVMSATGQVVATATPTDLEVGRDGILVETFDALTLQPIGSHIVNHSPGRREDVRSIQATFDGNVLLASYETGTDSPYAIALTAIHQTGGEAWSTLVPLPPTASRILLMAVCGTSIDQTFWVLRTDTGLSTNAVLQARGQGGSLRWAVSSPIQVWSHDCVANETGPILQSGGNFGSRLYSVDRDTGSVGPDVSAGGQRSVVLASGPPGLVTQDGDNFTTQVYFRSTGRFPLTFRPDPDSDGDGVADEIDNCPVDVNPGQVDRDADGLGDVCDPVRVAIVGDSYISGEGSGNFVEGTDTEGGGLDVNPFGGDVTENKCHRSEGSWAFQIALELTGGNRDQIGFFACSGATTTQFFEPNGGTRGFEAAQEDQLIEFAAAGEVDVVLFSLGGNDAKFSGEISRCLWHPGCHTDILFPPQFRSGSEVVGSRDVQPKVEGVLSSVRTITQDAAIFHMAYPDPLLPNDNQCVGDGGLATLSSEIQYLSVEFVEAVNSAVLGAAESQGVVGVDPRFWFADRGICGAEPQFANGVRLGNDVGVGTVGLLEADTFHPSVAGYAEMARRFRLEFMDNGALRFPYKPLPNPTPADRASNSITIYQAIDGRTVAWGNNGSIVIQDLPDGTVVASATFSVPVRQFEGVSNGGTIVVPFTVPEGTPPGQHQLVVTADDEIIDVINYTVDIPAECEPVGPLDDVDGDGVMNACDPTPDDGPDADPDGDGIPSRDDDCPLVPNAGSQTTALSLLGADCLPGTPGFTQALPPDTYPSVDVTPPTLTFPQPNVFVDQSSPQTVSGTVSDVGSGVDRVEIVAIDLGAAGATGVTGLQAWTESGVWGSGLLETPVLAAEVANGEWSFSWDPVPGGSGSYVIGVRAFDQAGNNWPSGKAWQALVVIGDTTGPSISVSTPVVASNEIRWTGQASDDVAVRKVRMIVRHVETNEYWNGTSWITSAEAAVDPTVLLHADVANPLSPSTGWTYGLSTVRTGTFQTLHWTQNGAYTYSTSTNTTVAK